LNRSLLESVVRRISASADGGVSDADLLKRFAAGRDEMAFAAIVRRHGPLVWAVCRGMLPLEQDAEDAFQATFLALVKSAGTVRAPTSVGAWLHGAAYRVALKSRRTAGRRRPREQAAARSEAAVPIADSTWDQLRVVVHEEVNHLPESLRTAFVLCELEGVGQREAAAALGWKIGTLSGRLTKARKRLLERLDRRGVSAGLAVAAAVTGGAATACVPRAWTAKVIALARTGGDLNGIVSNTIIELARGATEVSMTRTKLLVAAAILAVLAGGTATALVPHAGAQPPAPGATPLPDLPPAMPPATPPLQDLPPATPLPASDETAAQPPAPPTPVELPRGEVYPRVEAAPRPPSMEPLGYTGSGMAAPRRQWEYSYAPCRTDLRQQFQRLLAKLGNEGWEYCGTDPITNADSTVTLVFKRPKGPDHAGSGGMTGAAPTYTPPTPSVEVPPYSTMPGAGGSRPGGAYPGTTQSTAPLAPAGGMGLAPRPNIGGGAGGLPGGLGVAPRPNTGGAGGALPSMPGGGDGGLPLNRAGMGGATQPRKSLPPTPAADNTADRNALVVHLKHVNAQDIASAVNEIFAEHGGRIVADPQTNSVILLGDDANVAQIKRLIEKLDKAPPPAGGGGPPKH